MKKIQLYKNYYDIVIMPPPQVRDYTLQLSRKIARQLKTNFILGKHKFIPHLSLYHVAIKPKDLPLVRKKLQDILMRIKLGTVRTVRVRRNSIEVFNAAWLRRLHILVLRNVSRFRNKDFDAAATWQQGASPSVTEKRNIVRYGSPHVGQLFRPHFTLTSPQNKKDGLKISRLVRGFKKQSFEADALWVCTLGPHHTCHRKVFSVSTK